MSKIKFYFMALAVLLNFSVINSASAEASVINKDSAEKSMYLVDVLHLQPNVEISRANTYFTRIMPIVAKHGLKRVFSYVVVNDMTNPNSPADMINIWSVSGEGTMPGIMNDPAYLKNVEFRNGTFDMSKTKMFILMPNK